MRLKELRGLPVIDPTAARKVGTVTDYQVDPAAGRLAALDIDPVDQSDGERIMGHRIRRVGRHAVILTGRSGSSALALALDNNERWLDTEALEGLEVLGDDGNRIGHLVDATFDPDSLQVEAYVLRSTFWERVMGRRGRVQPDKVHSCSRELMIVTSGHLKESVTEVRNDTTEALGVPLKVEDRVPAPNVGPVENGQRVPAHAE